jgi:hypothetical protein
MMAPQENDILFVIRFDRNLHQTLQRPRSQVGHQDIHHHPLKIPTSSIFILIST